MDERMLSNTKEALEGARGIIDTLAGIGINMTIDSGYGGLIVKGVELLEKTVAVCEADAGASLKNRDDFLTAIFLSSAIRSIEGEFAPVGISFSSRVGVGRAIIRLEEVLSDLAVAYLGIVIDENEEDCYTESYNIEFATDIGTVTELCINYEACDVSPSLIWECFGEEDIAARDNIIDQTGVMIGLF